MPGTTRLIKRRRKQHQRNGIGIKSAANTQQNNNMKETDKIIEYIEANMRGIVFSGDGKLSSNNQIVYDTLQQVVQDIKGQKYIDAPQETEESKMKLVGRLTSPYGERGFYRCEEGHEVYEKNGRYVLILTAITMGDKVTTKEVTFNPEELSKFMKPVKADV